MFPLIPAKSDWTTDVVPTPNLPCIMVNPDQRGTLLSFPSIHMVLVVIISLLIDKAPPIELAPPIFMEPALVSVVLLSLIGPCVLQLGGEQSGAEKDCDCAEIKLMPVTFDELIEKKISSVPLSRFTIYDRSSLEYIRLSKFSRISVAVKHELFKKYFDGFK